MIKENMVAIIDAGNTQLKLGVFINGQLADVEVFLYAEIAAFKTAMGKESFQDVFISSVLSEEDNFSYFGEFQVKFLSVDSKLPFEMDYASPETLGKDRIANAAGAIQYSKTSNALVIDLGTCIKFDMVNEGRYLGGSISPGMEMRYKALNTFTGKLPLLEAERMDSFIGGDTRSSMHVGVMGGIQGEIEHFIHLYESKFSDLTIIVTGGDGKRFVFPAKSNTFALENLTLKGLFYIYKLNESFA
jgi:type III pantothenate kinase